MDRREVMLKHYLSSPYKKEEEKEGYIKVNTKNDSCIDNLNIYVKFTNDVVTDAYFNGEACAIATSSCSILLDNVIGKTKQEIKEYIENFENMLAEKNYNEELLKEAIVYQSVIHEGHRITCAYLPYKGLKKIIAE